MKYKQLQIDFRQTRDLDSMHTALATLFGFPSFYGKNVNALIDCLSSLRFPDDEMTEIVIANDEQISLKVMGLSSLDEIIANHFLNAIEAVNSRSIQLIGEPSILLVLV